MNFWFLRCVDVVNHFLTREPPGQRGILSASGAAPEQKFSRRNGNKAWRAFARCVVKARFTG